MSERFDGGKSDSRVKIEELALDQDQDITSGHIFEIIEHTLGVVKDKDRVTESMYGKEVLLGEDRVLVLSSFEHPDRKDEVSVSYMVSIPWHYGTLDVRHQHKFIKDENGEVKSWHIAPDIDQEYPDDFYPSRTVYERIYQNLLHEEQLEISGE